MLMYVLKGTEKDRQFLIDKCVFIGPEDQCAAYMMRNRVKAKWDGKGLCMTSGNGIGLGIDLKMAGVMHNQDKVFKAYRSKRKKK